MPWQCKQFKSESRNSASAARASDRIGPRPLSATSVLGAYWPSAVTASTDALGPPRPSRQMLSRPASPPAAVLTRTTTQGLGNAMPDPNSLPRRRIRFNPSKSTLRFSGSPWPPSMPSRSCDDAIDRSNKINVPIFFSAIATLNRLAVRRNKKQPAPTKTFLEPLGALGVKPPTRAAPRVSSE